jgi:F420H(2)-dependent quinone reductase
VPDSLTERLAAVKDRGTCRITTRGRRTGKPHTRTIWFVVENTVLYLGTLNARRDWVRNAQKNPDVELDLGALRVRGRLSTITDPQLDAHVHELIAAKYWAAWIASWFGKGPERTFRVEQVTPAG